jgi:hypothetical protein
VPLLAVYVAPSEGRAIDCRSATRPCGIPGGFFLVLADASEGYRVEIALILWRFGKRIPVHLFANGVLYNFAGNLHEVALRGWAFRHECIMPRSTGDRYPVEIIRTHYQINSVSTDNRTTSGE